MKRLSLILAISVALAADSGYNLFQKGLARERADADPRGAIKIYEQVVRENAKDRKLAAQALVRIAECYAKLGDLQSRQVYERIVRDYADQSDAVTTARTRLAAAPAPPATGITARQLWAGRGVDGDGSISPDGRFLSFIDWSTGNLAIRDLTSGTTHLLTDTKGWGSSSGTQALHSVISPDGRSVAYAWYIGNEHRTELRILPLGAPPNTNPTIVPASETGYGSLEPFSWSPDGKDLLATAFRPDRTRHIIFISVATGATRTLKVLDNIYSAPRLSPDGRFIAFDARAQGQQQKDIFVMPADGSQETVVSPSSSGDSNPVWSPDGKTLLFRSERTGATGLISVRMENGKPVGEPQIVRGDLGAATLIDVTRQGSLTYFLSGGPLRDIYVANLDSSAPALATDRNLNANLAPAWSPDGAQLAYLTASKINAYSLVIRTIATGVERTVPVTAAFISRFSAGPRWFPDGRSVLLLGRSDGAKGMPFLRVDVATGKAEPLHYVGSNSLSSYQLSTDGNSLYYCLQQVKEGSRPANASGEILRYDFGASAPVVLRKQGWFITLALSPDGRQLAFLQSHERGESSISIIPTAGGEPREIVRSANWADGSRYNGLAWTADQKSLLYTRGGPTALAPPVLWRVPAAGGTSVRTGIELRTHIKNLAVHPDGRRLAYSTQESSYGEIWSLDNFLPR